VARRHHCGEPNLQRTLKFVVVTCSYFFSICCRFLSCLYLQRKYSFFNEIWFFKWPKAWLVVKDQIRKILRKMKVGQKPDQPMAWINNLALIPNETNKVRHTQIIQNIWNIVIKSIWTNIYVIRMNSKMITIENEGSFIYPRRGALNQ
jgi:hypothetical protein